MGRGVSLRTFTSELMPRHFLLLLIATLFPATVLAQEKSGEPKNSEPTTQPTVEGEAAAPSGEALLKAADEIAAKVAEIRGLELKAPVKKGIKQRHELRAVLMQKLSEEVSDSQIDAEAAVFKRLGVIPQDLDYKKVLLDVLTEQIAGFYDQKSKELYVMEGIPLAMARPAMAHELFHALQDQHFDILNLQEPFDTTENSDFALARSALLEGDATILMFDFEMYESGQLPAGNQTSLIDIPIASNMLRRLDFNSLMNNPMLGGLGGAGFDVGESALAKAPAVFRESLVFPYFAGMRFIVIARTQRTWKDVDRIYENPPVSTEQILHPQRYFDGDHPEWLDFTAGVEGYEKIYDSVIGEFQLLQFLKAHPTDGVDPAAAAMGWDGDRVFAYQPEGGDKTALVLVSSWDSIAEAQEFFESAKKISKQRYPNALEESKAEGHGQSVCLVIGEGDARERLYIEQWGDLVLYVEGTPSELDADGKELNPATYSIREQVWKSLKRRPFHDEMNDRMKAKAAKKAE